MRLNYLLAKSYLSINEEGKMLTSYSEAHDLLEYLGENGLMNFKDFYRYVDKLGDIEFFVYAKFDWFAA